MADVLITDAPTVREIAERIINEEAEFERLRLYHVVYVFRDKAQKKLSKTVYGTAEVVRGKNAHLYWSAQGKEYAPAFFRIVIAEDIWHELDEEQKAWLVRHELRHCGVKFTKDGPRLTLVPHDIELFFADIKDPVFDDVCKVIEAVKQIKTRMEL